MSEYQQFLKERDHIDGFLQKGYKIKNIIENLSGAFCLFEKYNSKGEKERESIHIITPAGRKYFSVQLIQQQNSKPS